MTDVKEILSHIDYLMSNHDGSLDYEAALEDVRSFILEREKGDHVVYKYGMVEPAEIYAQEKEKEPIDDDIEKAVDEYLSNYFGGEKEKQEWPFLKKMAIHFAEWQKQKDANLIFNAKEDGYRLGLATMKQQMMKDAVSAKITEVYYPTDSCLEVEVTLPKNRFEDGDKILIIKKD